MIKLFKVKEKQREIAANANGVPPVKKQTAGELRLQKDISELNLPKTCSISFPNGKDDLMNFEVTIHPDEGYYLGGTFLFSFQVSPVYPHEPPKVKCKTKVTMLTLSANLFVGYSLTHLACRCIILILTWKEMFVSIF
uniref:UBC core domain-containing protein n=1 Tax=Cucumis melo TaxID=3656 RepID=A0A9I9D3P9_CUCME